jgi:SAM-dependent methyltransferase
VKEGKLLGVVMPIDVSVEQQLIAKLGPRASKLIREISPNDQMYNGVRGTYLQHGLWALVHIKQAMESAGISHARRVLDHACGHGRVMRFLRLAFPNAELTACDIQRDGVDFCASTFDARPVYSAPDPSQVPLEGKFDLIWVGSLFTHLDREAWLDFFSFLIDHLAHGGLLVFTTQDWTSAGLRGFGLLDEQIRPMLEDYERDGFGYQDYQGSAEWGVTVCSRDFVVDRIQEQPSVRLTSYVPSAWGQQNVVACAKPRS